MSKFHKIPAYWFSKKINFGDCLTPSILEYFGFTPVWVPIEQSRVLVTGSILQGVQKTYSGHILGSGLIRDISHQLANAKIWAVRGKLTRERIGAPASTVLGDPGLLSSELLNQRQQRQYVLGIVPHSVDKSDPRIALIKKKYERDVLIIDVNRNPPAVFEDIDKCDCILSSSLHGLVVADSFDIPNIWIQLSNKVNGEGFKFRDYYSAFEAEHTPLHLNGHESLSTILKCAHKPPEQITKIKAALNITFRRFRDHIDFTS